MDLSKELIKLFPNNNYVPLIINLANNLVTPIVDNSRIKRKCNNMLSLIIESMNRYSKVLRVAMDKINIIQLMIKESHWSSWPHLEKTTTLPKARDKKVHKMKKNMVNVLFWHITMLKRSSSTSQNYFQLQF